MDLQVCLLGGFSVFFFLISLEVLFYSNQNPETYSSFCIILYKYEPDKTAPKLVANHWLDIGLDFLFSA